ncbi:hypothetical protein JCM8547_005074 [Rhodosporidiobolus lusitaniae]
MPFKPIPHRDLEMFYVLNPDPSAMLSATHDTLPSSQPFKTGLPTLVFIHAAGANVTSWRSQLSDPRLSQAFNLFAMDCRFHGFTRGGERTEHTLENSAECVLATVEEMRFGRFSLYGEGVHGSQIASWIAAKLFSQSSQSSQCASPCPVVSLCLASPGFPSEPSHITSMLRSVQEEALANKDGKGDGTGRISEEALEDLAGYFIGGSERVRGEREGMKRRLQSRYGTGHSSHDLRWLFLAIYSRRPIPQPLLDLVTCPVLILRGAEDTIVSPPAAVEAWVASFPNASTGTGPQTHTIASAPSLISLSDSNVVNRVLLQFVGRSWAA